MTKYILQNGSVLNHPFKTRVPPPQPRPTIHWLVLDATAMLYPEIPIMAWSFHLQKPGQMIDVVLNSVLHHRIACN